MPGVITVGEFVREAKEDQASPTTSTFVQRIPACRESVTRQEEVGLRHCTVATLITE